VAGGGDNPLAANNVPGKPRVLNPGESGASNLGPRSKVLLENTEQLVAYWRDRGVNPTPDLVTSSGSGYDPDISQQDALVQIPMVSRATGLSPPVLRHLVVSETQGAELGFLGTPYIDVLQLNEALAKLKT
jgi:K+-transporting ATPase ATPase C chain